MSLLAADDLTLRVGDRLLVDRLSVRFDGGQRWVILGNNGSGKTTLLHTLAGLHVPQSGSVQHRDSPLADHPARERARAIGVLFQDSEPSFPSTVIDLALSGRHPHLGRFAWEDEQDVDIAQDALARVGLRGFDTRLLATLSGGERRRAEFAALLTQQVPIWMLDEPTSHLDLAHQATVLDMAHQHGNRHDQLCVFVLHDINQALHYASHGILLFGDGRWQAGALAQIATREALEQLYRCPLRELMDGDDRYYVMS